MQINVREVAELLKVSEKTIYRWIQQKKLPAFKINEQYRFNRTELLEWVTTQRINVSVDLLHDPDAKRTPNPSLIKAIKAGGIHYRVCGKNKESVLRSVVDIVPLPEEVDRNFMFQVLMARESMGTTAIGNGIAIPHVRNPIILHIVTPIIAICFLETPIDFGALDGKPVDTLFTIISPTIPAHLHLLSILSYALKQRSFSKMIIRKGTRDEIFDCAAKIDKTLQSGSKEEPIKDGQPE